MKSRHNEPRILVDGMLRYCETVAHWVNKGHDAFRDPETGIQAAIERQFEQFEEVANALGAAFRKADSAVPWAPTFEIRNDLSHPYQRAYDPEKLWHFVTDDFPKVTRRLRSARFPRKDS